MLMTVDQEETEEKRKWQERFDRWAHKHGTRAPAFSINQSVNDYVRETCRTFKRAFLPQNHPYYKINYRGAPPDALGPLVPQLLDACAKEAYNPATVPPGQFREIIETDSLNGQKIHKFVGPESFVRQMDRPGRRAVIRTPDTHPGWFSEANRRANTNRAESAIRVIY